MAASVRLVYNGPHDAVLVPGVADPVRRGQEFSVEPETAGAPSGWAKPPPGLLDDPREAAFHETRADKDGNITEVHLLGSGLLAHTHTDPATGETVPDYTAVKAAPKGE